MAEHLKGIRWKVMYVCPQYPVLNKCMWKVVCARGSTSRAKDGQTRCWSRRGGAEQGHACWLSCPLNPSAFSLISFSFRTLSTSCTHWVVCMSVCAALQHTRHPELHVHVRACVREWCLFSCSSWSWSIYWVVAHNQVRRMGCVIEPFLQKKQEF